VADRIVELRRQRFTGKHIASAVAVSLAMVNRERTRGILLDLGLAAAEEHIRGAPAECDL